MEVLEGIPGVETMTGPEGLSAFSGGAGGAAGALGAGEDLLKVTVLPCESLMTMALEVFFGLTKLDCAEGGG